MKENKKPLVSISCITYNHEKYIRDTIESFLMQMTTFPFEILIHDDASTDGTANIIKEYQKKYPDIIYPIYQKENQYSKKIRITATYQLPRARGKYIAICEGDDYWIDPNKLQKQVDFLERNLEYGLVCTDIILINEKGQTIADNKMVLQQREKRKPEITFFDLLEIPLVNTPTVCARAHILNAIGNRVIKENLWYYQDYGYWLQLSMVAKIKILFEKTAAYRVHDQSLTQTVEGKTHLIRWDAIKCLLDKKKSFSADERQVIWRHIVSLLRDKRISIRSKFDIFFHSTFLLRYIWYHFIKKK